MCFSICKQPARRHLPCASHGQYAALRVSVEFFESQFQRQVKAREFELNPFERVALGYVQGDVLDLGCGLGNLAVEAARRGCTVTAIDASPTAIEQIRAAANEGRLAVDAIQADLTDFKIERDYDTIVAIGLLMFFKQSRALTLLGDIQAHIRPGGRVIVNVLVQGTTYMEMFAPGNYYLFGREELAGHFLGWVIELSRFEDFPAPGGTLKSFATLIALKPPVPLPW
jgi:tellurite methyltransferase